ncbi:unnamed protein product [Kuraishia capsulata CBS 1993]|uniref:Xanthine dehydrogenase n=1 Tax=Kuraishia capsulata CBS 1993 TaxID=1382522 RepID=W6MPS7_9ASCO|nr:uncharacterized protein KUCA_T00003149001 [Kuraishia capsulata CBS 1993]CDK27172.1 unnamed protein product [Kuraishia capsulata CBS 1993]
MAPSATIIETESITVLHDDLSHIRFASTLQFYLNGELQTVRDPDPEGTLLDYIRSEAGLTGTKLGCSEGGCGACTITVAHYDEIKNKITYEAMNSCIIPLIAVEGKHLITVEGIGSTNNPHPVQERIAKYHGSQCGFCTPGIVMSMYSLLREKNGHVSKELISEALDGNLCRCTGYMPIIQACNSFAYDSDNYNKAQLKPGSVTACSKGADCCQNKKNGAKAEPEVEKVEVCARGDSCCKNKTIEANGVAESEASGSTHDPSNEIDVNALFTPNGLPLKPYNPKDDLVFPAKLTNYKLKPIFYGNEHKVWFRPTTKQELLEIVASYPQCKIVSGASEVQVEIKMKAADYNVSIFVNDIAELRTWEYIEGKGLLVGANISVSELEYIGEDLAEKLGKHTKGQVFEHMTTQLKYFAGRQIRNAASPAGNIVTASPISDLNPVLVACGAIVTYEQLDPTGKVISGELNMNDFFIGYRKHRLPQGAIVTSIFIPETRPNEFIHSYKQSKRKDDDIAIVTACIRVKLDSEGLVEDSTLAYGGMAAMTVQSKQTQEAIKGMSIFDPSFLEIAVDNLDKDYPLGFGVPGGMATYRRTLTFSFFYKFWQYMLAGFNSSHPSAKALLEVDSNAKVTRNKPEGWRDLETPFEYEVVGKSNPHLSAMKQVSGEAVYTDDIPPQHKEIFGVQVLSTKAHAKVLSVDYTDALTVETVVGYIDIDDLPNKEANLWGPLPFGKEQFFSDGEVFVVGQTIGVVFATNKERAAEASRLVRVEYEELPAIISVEDAVAQESFFPDSRITELGDWESAFKNSKHFFEGTIRFGAQEHFYFETQGCLVIPEEDGEIKVYASTQNPTETQEYAAQVTGVAAHKVVTRVKRLGGGFGGKETRSVQLSSLACVAAKKFNRPVRMSLSRYEDMLTSGQRHPFLMKYRVSLDEDLKFTGLDTTLYANGGWSMDLTRGVIDRAVFHACNCYYFPNVRVAGIPCKTNTASNTAYRGFGGPQGMYLAEGMLVEVAEKLGVDPDVIRQKNYFTANTGQITPYKQKVDDDISVRDIVKQNWEEANYDQLRKDVEDFNAKSKWIKRGLAHVPTMFGVSFGVKFLNQAGALVHIYHDGSVLVSHGGVEIGQGLYTKMTMIAAQELGVPIEKVFISETSTQVVPNTSATAASAASDLNGMAIANACEKLNERLKPIREQLGPDATFDEVISTAYHERISLSATGFYKTPDIGYLFGDPDPAPAFFYFTQGSAICQVEVDTLTGDWSCLEAHIKMDIGRPINQAIDYGQIEGAFVQGMGLFTMEQSLWFRHNGALFTRGPGNYKIPGFRDVPQKFRVSMLKDRDFKHLKTIKSSKGIGEPPLFLGSCVQFAIRNAISYARRDNGYVKGAAGLPVQSPLTSERIRASIGDMLVKKGLVVPKNENERDFFIEA